MKLYNPFKPHLVKIGNRYAIRKFTLFYWWVFIDKRAEEAKSILWWSSNYTNYYLFDSLDAAQKVFKAKPWKVIVLEA